MGVIFNNNGNPQTADLSFTGNGCYQGGTWKTLQQCGFTVSNSQTSVSSSSSSSRSSSSVAASKTRIYLKNTMNYATPYIHYFNVIPAAANSVWPGKIMKNLNNGWFSFEFDTNVTSAGIVFNNNAAPQTANLTFTAPNNCYNNGVWQTAAACGAPSDLTANAGVDRKANVNTRQALSAAGSIGTYTSATWTSPAWAGTLTGTQVVTPVLTSIGNHTVTLTLTSADNQVATDTMVINVVAAAQGLPERPQLAAPLGFPISGNVSAGKYRFVQAYPGLDGRFPTPVHVTNDGVNDLIYVVDKSGTVSVFPNREDVAANEVKVLIDIQATVRNKHEQGLLSMTFDPNYASNGYIYIYYIFGTDDANEKNANGTFDDAVLERWTVNNPTNPTSAGGKVELLRVPQFGPDHKGGMMQFHPTEGYLYLGIGDGAYGHSATTVFPADPRTNNSAQQTDNLRGKFIRIKPLANAVNGKFYEVPADNPFVGRSGFMPEIWSYGHRNPWRWGFDKKTGAMWETEVGQQGFEEVNLITKGGNYGWPVCEGLTNRGSLGGDSTKNCTTDFIPPRDGYGRDQGVSIIGGLVYSGTALPALTGKFVFGDYVSKRIWSIANDGTPKQIISEAFPANIASFGTDKSGDSLLITSYQEEYGGKAAIYKMVDDDAVAAQIPTKLSATGLFADLANLIPAHGVIEYDLNSEGWFDGAVARHFVAVPNDKTIGFDPTALWDLPVGSVLVKHLSVAASGNPNKSFTTSVLFRQVTGWQAANYRWNLAGTDADLVTTSVTVADGAIVNRQRVVQTGSDCGSCHTGIGTKNPLATDTRQFNGSFNYQGVNANQLDVFNKIGLFSSGINNPSSYDSFAAANDTSVDLTSRAKAYMHTNCAHCHSSSGFMDLRYDTALDAMHLVNEGGAVKRILPGEPANSLVYIFQTTDGNRMPKGSSYTNPAADSLFSEWITALGRDAVQTAVELTSDKTTLAVNDAVTLTLKAIFDNGVKSLASGSVVWTSTNPAVIDVSSASGATASLVAKSVGSVTITATQGGFSKSVSFDVSSDLNLPTSLKVVGLANLSLINGETQQLVAVATVEDKLVGVTGLATWSSSNNGVVSVSSSGVLTGGLTAGAATITATYKGISATFAVTNIGEGQYVYFNKPVDWNAPTAYIWTNQNGVDTPRAGAWPGSRLDKVATKYGANWLRITIPKAWANAAGETRMVFSNNGATKTADLTINQTKPWWYDTAWLAAAPLGSGVETGTQIQVGNGSISVSGSANLTGKLFVPGTAVDIKANATGPGMKFVRWEGPGAPYLVNPNSTTTQMVVGSGISFTLLAVFDSVTDEHVTGRQFYQNQNLGCVSCHGLEGKSSPSLVGLQSRYTTESLAAYIATNMPKNNKGACTGDCASSIAAMILDEAFVAPAGVCDATSLDDLIPQDRNFRLLSTLEYNNSVRDLLGLTGNVDFTTGRIPADIPVNGFKTNANSVFTNDYAKGYLMAAEAAAGTVSNIFALTPGCSNVTCFVQNFGKRAYRRPLSTTEVTKLVALQAEQGNLGLLTAILSSPSMLYRSEVGVANGAGYYELTDYEVASMLSYTYWATTPDAALMAAADAGELSTPAQISARVRSMLQDPKAKLAFERFIYGWLDLEKDVKPTDISASLKADMKTETVEFVKRTVFDGGTYRDLLTANYSYMTQQLANHYGFTWPGGTGVQRVNYSGVNGERRGVLGHASILGIQSAAEKTHPVKRGLFVRRNLLCQDFPPPPLGAALQPQNDPTLTVRERFETAHLQDGCESCHQYIDGIGFGLENYNPKGLFVTTEITPSGAEKPINSAGYIGSINSAETFLSESEPIVPYQGMDELAGLIADSGNGRACYARQWYRYTRGQREEVEDSCTLQVFGEAFKTSSNASMLDLMIQFTQTKNYILRK